MTETAAWSIASIVISIVVVPVVVQGLELWRRRHDAAHFFLNLLERIHGQLSGIRSILNDESRNLLASFGPVAVRGQLGELQSLFGDYEHMRLERLPDLRSKALVEAIERGILAARGHYGIYHKLAQPYVEGVAEWEFNQPDPGIVAYVHNQRDSLDNGLEILRYAINRLRAATDFWRPLRLFGRAALRLP